MDVKTNLSQPTAAAVFTEIKQGIMPAEPTQKALIERLAPYSRVLLNAREEGYSYQQLATILADPKIGIELSPSKIKKYLLARKSRAEKRKAQAQPKPKATTPATVKS